MRLLEGDGLIVMRLFGVGPVLGFQLKSDYEGAQAAFKSASPDKIYIDINAGLMSGKDVSDLAKYAMLRTFSHEFIHFVEYWNPVQYNVLRKLVFDEITARGENVNDLIESKMDSTGLSYEKASREVVAEAMTDILPDSKFGKNMAEKHKSLFHKLVEKLKEFVADLRAYFDTIGGNRSAEANALKEQVGDTIKYIDSIVDMFDTVASEAVETFQKAYAVEEVTEGISTVSEDESVNEDSTAAVKEKENTPYGRCRTLTAAYRAGACLSLDDFPAVSSQRLFTKLLFPDLRRSYLGALSFPAVSRRWQVPRQKR